ncbi:MAG: hypothetical protein ABI216_08090 [Devosia sp.]
MNRQKLSSTGQRKLPAIAALIGFATFATIALLPGQAQAACRGGFCVSGSDNGPQHFVNFTTSWTNITHFNFSRPDGKQVELGANQRQVIFTNLPSGSFEQYGFQACTKVSVFSSSQCTPWAYFTHTAP